MHFYTTVSMDLACLSHPLVGDRAFESLGGKPAFCLESIERINFNSLAEVDFRGRDLTKLLNPVVAQEESWADYVSDHCHFEIHFGPQSINTLQYFC